MAKAHKTGRRRQAAPRRPRPTPWAWFAAGVAVGLVPSIVLYVQPRPAPEAAAVAEAERPGAARAPAARGGPKPRFEFYTILPEKEVSVPESEINPPAGTQPPPEAAPRPGATYVIQVGSFRKATEADRLKASLALIGLEAEIQTVTVNGSETWHRVRLGPFTDLTALNAARARLREHDMKALVLRIRT